MSTEHATLPAEDTQRSHGGPDSAILNTTKVVRLFVLDPANGRTEKYFRDNESATRADVFVERTKLKDGARSAGHLVAKSIGLKDMVGHDEAHVEHPGSVVVLSADAGDQIEWQCDVPFRIVKIEKSEHVLKLFPNDGTPPLYPFIKTMEALRERSLVAPIRSGALQKGNYRQLYKAHFELFIDGQWTLLDPDFYGTCGN
jgi:hypothetical protein